MDMIYISHPYTGDEENNKASADRIAAELAQKYPDAVFINPLNAMKHLKDTDIPYEDVLEQCKALLAKCDGVIMAGDWVRSLGCTEEYLYAKSLHMNIWERPMLFEREYHKESGERDGRKSRV